MLIERLKDLITHVNFNHELIDFSFIEHIPIPFLKRLFTSN